MPYGPSLGYRANRPRTKRISTLRAQRIGVSTVDDSTCPICKHDILYHEIDANSERRHVTLMCKVCLISNNIYICKTRDWNGDQYVDK